MNLNKCLIISALFFGASLMNTVAQAETTDESGMYYYDKGRATYVYEESTPLFAEESEKSTLLETLPVGSAVTIEEDKSDYAGDHFLTKNGMELPFVKVSSTDSTGHKKLGYVWAGNLSKTAITEDLELDDEKELILSNIVYRGVKADQNYATLGIKVLKNGKVFDDTTFEMPYTEVSGLQTTVYVPAGFSPFIAILKENFVPGACGVLGGHVFFAWHKGYWVKGFSEDEISDAGAFSNHVEFVFPLDRDGKMNAIKAIRTIESDFDDQTNQYKTKEQEVTVYDWQDGVFVKTVSKARD